MQPQEISHSPAGQGAPRPGGALMPAISPFLPDSAIQQCRSFRDACRLAWEHRTEKGMTQAYLGMLCNLYPQHVSDYFHLDAKDPKGRTRRALPAELIAIVEEKLGNRAISQYLARSAMLHYLEQTVFGTRVL
jgi:hypothetical protein